jgi:hypothetical protein
VSGDLLQRQAATGASGTAAAASTGRFAGGDVVVPVRDVNTLPTAGAGAGARRVFVESCAADRCGPAYTESSLLDRV